MEKISTDANTENSVHKRPVNTPTSRIHETSSNQKMEQLYQGWEQKISAIPKAITEWFGAWWGIIENLPARNYHQAEDYFDQKLFYDASLRLKVAIWLAPEFPRAYLLLARTYQMMNKHDKALEFIKIALRMNPDSPETIFVAAGIDSSLLPKEKKPKTMPMLMSQRIFDKQAENFDEMQKSRMYRGHVHADQMVRRFTDTRRTNYKLLDLGCGTGAVGMQLYNISSDITGVDFVRSMLDQAMERKRENHNPVYNKTFHTDIGEFLHNKNEEKYDFITLAHVLNFVGELDVIFSGMAKSLEDEGIIVIQVEPYDKKDFGVIEGSGRFGHSDEYIRRQAEISNLEIIDVENVMVYKSLKMVQYAIGHKKKKEESEEL